MGLIEADYLILKQFHLMIISLTYNGKLITCRTLLYRYEHDLT